MRKVGREYFVHSIPVFNLYQEHIGLKNAVHRPAADFYKLLYFVHDHGGVRFNGPFFLISRIVRALARDVQHPVVDDHWHDDVLLTSGLAIAVQLTDAVGILRGGTLRESRRGQNCGSDSEGRKHGSEPLRKHPASQVEIHIRSPFELYLHLRGKLRRTSSRKSLRLKK
jgi:hypothetical protein